MNRVPVFVAILVTAVLAAGCSAASPRASQDPNPPAHSAMPEVHVEGPEQELRPLTEVELTEMMARPVSGAVNTLMAHGYAVVLVVNESGQEMPQNQWDLHGVLDVSVSGADARVTVG